MPGISLKLAATAIGTPCQRDGLVRATSAITAAMRKRLICPKPRVCDTGSLPRSTSATAAVVTTRWSSSRSGQTAATTLPSTHQYARSDAAVSRNIPRPWETYAIGTMRIAENGVYVQGSHVPMSPSV